MAPDQIYRITKAPATSFYSGTKTGAKHLIWSRTKNSESYILWQECQVRSQLFWNRLETTHLKCLAILTLQNWSTPCLSPSTHPLHISGASRQHNASCGQLSMHKIRNVFFYSFFACLVFVWISAQLQLFWSSLWKRFSEWKTVIFGSFEPSSVFEMKSLTLITFYR